MKAFVSGTPGRKICLSPLAAIQPSTARWNLGKSSPIIRCGLKNRSRFSAASNATGFSAESPGSAGIRKDLASTWVELSSEEGGRSVRVDFTGFPDLGIWSCRNDGPYVCIEPWFGVDSTKGDSGAFEEKEGLRLLSAGDTFEAAFGITLE